MLSLIFFVIISYLCYQSIQKLEKKPFEHIGRFFVVIGVLGLSLFGVYTAFSVLAIVISVSNQEGSYIYLALLGDAFNMFLGPMLYNSLHNQYISVLKKDLKVPTPP